MLVMIYDENCLQFNNVCVELIAHNLITFAASLINKINIRLTQGLKKHEIIIGLRKYLKLSNSSQFKDKCARSNQIEKI